MHNQKQSKSYPEFFICKQVTHRSTTKSLYSCNQTQENRYEHDLFVQGTRTHHCYSCRIINLYQKPNCKKSSMVHKKGHIVSANSGMTYELRYVKSIMAGTKMILSHMKRNLKNVNTFHCLLILKNNLQCKQICYINGDFIPILGIVCDFLSSLFNIAYTCIHQQNFELTVTLISIKISIERKNYY